MSPQLRLKSAQGGTRQVRLPDLQCGASLAEATTGDPSAPCHIYNIRTKFYVYSDDTHTQTHTHTLLHTNTFTHRPSYTQAVKLLHTNPFTHRHFDTQKLRHTDPIYTQTLLHTNAYTLTLTPFYIQHQLNRNFTSVFAHRASFRAKGLLRHKKNRNFSSVFAHRASFRAKGLLQHK